MTFARLTCLVCLCMWLWGELCDGDFGGKGSVGDGERVLSLWDAHPGGGTTACQWYSSGRPPGLGFLDPGCSEEDLPADSKVEIPLWMARALRERSMVRLDYPRHYTTQFREDLLAGPESIKIREKSQFFYEVGNILARVKHDDHLQRTMRMTFSGQRFRDILDASLNTSAGDDMTDFLKDLPVAERKVFAAGSEGSEEYNMFKRGLHQKLTVPKVLENSMILS